MSRRHVRGRSHAGRELCVGFITRIQTPNSKPLREPAALTWLLHPLHSNCPGGWADAADVSTKSFRVESEGTSVCVCVCERGGGGPFRARSSGKDGGPVSVPDESYLQCWDSRRGALTSRLLSRGLFIIFTSFFTGSVRSGELTTF